MDKKKKMKVRRHARVRAKVNGTKDKPRLSVFRSNKHIYAQLIDDNKGVTLVSASDMGMGIKKGKTKKGAKTKTEYAREVGVLIAKTAKTKKIKTIVFDRGGFLYTGRVEALAKSAREEGLVF